MLCNKCKKREATTHVKSVVNGKYEEYMLCSACANELGYNNMWGDFTSDFSSILGSFFSNALPERTATTRCPVCGSTFHDISQSSKVGCAKCYELFYSDLMPSIKRIHSNTTHNGKRPPQIAQLKSPEKDKSAVDNDKSDINNNDIEKLRHELENAVKEQNFELAAELRDKIKEMEESK